jgi:hypothetical protein
LVDDLAGLRESAGVVLAEDLPAVDDDIEDAAPAADELGLYAGLSFDLFRQTGGVWKVVSFATIGDGDDHALVSSQSA